MEIFFSKIWHTEQIVTKSIEIAAITAAKCRPRDINVDDINDRQVCECEDSQEESRYDDGRFL